MVNRLAQATSPYLQQHRDNPVDWYEWGDEAFEQARRRDVPVLLSIGYAACHWCHVMAHESFEDAATAALMNEHFVNVKVDREERPDVDAVYMGATQALTGHGGWPMTVFLTHDGRPFYAGTYFPPAASPRHGMPSFPQLLTAITQTWRERRGEVETAGERISAALAAQDVPGGHGAGTDPGPPDDALLEAAVRALVATEDTTHGGFGGAPKFPPSMSLEFLLRHAARRSLAAPAAEAFASGSGAVALDAAARTLHVMSRSGMYDQLEGGFARYAVDAGWVVPHFEKMLYDNALLARVYLHWWRLTGEPTGARVALETCDWMIARLGTAHGGLASSLDADTPVRDASGAVHGVEGFTYAWTPAQLLDALGPADAAWAGALLAVTPTGTFEHGTSTLQRTRDLDAAGPSDESARWESVRERLLAVRARRPQPARDDKVVAAWNGLAIAALAETGALLDRPDLVAAAERAADLLVAVHVVAAPAGDGVRVRLRRVSRDGAVGTPAGVLEDYADVAEGLLALHGVTGEPSWLELTGNLLDTVLASFADGGGGFHPPRDAGTAAALASVRRPQDPTDNAYPGGWSAAAGALLSYAALTGSDRHRRAAEAALAVVTATAVRAPRAFGWGLAVAEALADGPREVAVTGPDGDPRRDELRAAALAGTAPGAVLSVGEPDAPGVPLLTGRPLVDGAPAGYVCRSFVCAAPTTSPQDLARALGATRRPGW